MSQYIVSARKYRPVTFDTVVGQEALTTTLKNAIASGKLAHAYLFCGPRGVGKTTCARIFAKTINCEHRNAQGEACDQCESCQAFNEQRSLNIHELDAASNNSVDEMRQLIEQVQVPPQIGRYKVFIIDEVHMLSTAAFNAFLKTLEEPPSHAIFVLATTEKHKILPTILSRCQIYDFNRMEVPGIVNHLKNVAAKEGITYEEEALNVIAQKADGGMRDALSIFDQVASFTNGNITYQKVIEDLNILDYDYYFRITDEMLKADVPATMVTLNEILTRGFQAQQFINGLASHFRNLLMTRDQQTLPLLEVSESVRQRYAEQAQRCPVPTIYRALKLCNNCDINYRQSHNKRLLVELTLIQVAQLSDTSDEAPGNGLGPTTRRLKPIFAAIAASRPQQQIPTAPRTDVRTTIAPAHTTTAPTPVKEVQTVPKPAFKPIQPTKGGVYQHTISITLPSKQQMAVQEAPVVDDNNLPSAEEEDTKKENLPLMEEDVARTWMRYVLQMPREQIAYAERMKGMVPRLIDDAEVEVIVENAHVKEHIDRFLPNIEAYMRTELRNRNIHFVTVVNTTETVKRLMNPADIYKFMADDQPLLESLRKSLHLELS